MEERNDCDHQSWLRSECTFSRTTVILAFSKSFLRLPTFNGFRLNDGLTFGLSLLFGLEITGRELDAAQLLTQRLNRREGRDLGLQSRNRGTRSRSHELERGPATTVPFDKGQGHPSSSLLVSPM